MTKILITLFQILSLALLGTACSKNSATIGTQTGGVPTASSSQTSAATSGEVHYKAPAGWVTEKPTSDMRLAQYKLPKADGDTEDGLLVVYYFGPGQGGTPQANIDRWVGQVKQADGSDSKDKAKTATMKVRQNFCSAPASWTQIIPASGTTWAWPRLSSATLLMPTRVSRRRKENLRAISTSLLVCRALAKPMTRSSTSKGR